VDRERAVLTPKIANWGWGKSGRAAGSTEGYDG